MGIRPSTKYEFVCDRCGMVGTEMDRAPGSYYVPPSWGARFEMILCPGCAESFDQWRSEGKPAEAVKVE